MLGILFVGVKWINKDAATIEEQQLKYSGVTTGIQSIQPEDNKDEESSETVQETQELKKDENGKYILNNGDIFAYTGYMDELAKTGYWWIDNYDFEDADFDHDGLHDRIYSEKEIGSEVTSEINIKHQIYQTYYRIEFGNGEVAKIGPFNSHAFYLQCADLTGDEIMN